MKMRAFGLGLLGFLSLMLAACGGSSSDTAADKADPVTGGAPLGQPASYGDAPAKSTMSLDGYQALIDFCQTETGSTLTWTDASGEARSACVINRAGASATHPLPLLVYLHPSLFDANKTLPLTGLLTDSASADLTGDATRAGFVLLMPAGRDTEHYYPFPDDTGLGWDNWYRNLDRSSPALNVDVATIDHFIAAVKSTGIVDPLRVYLSGWSNGAAMAQLYALNTPGIAAAAVYSSPAPYSDVKDPGAQTPFATNLTPLMDIHNQCDIIGICQTGTAFHQQLSTLFPKLVQRPVLIDEAFNEVQACDASCASPDIATSSPIGAANHLRWPVSWNTQMYAFLKAHTATAP